MTNFTSVDKFIIDRLRTTKSLSLYELHVNHEFSPIQLQDSSLRLEECQFVKFDRSELVIQRVPNFNETLIKFRHKIYNRDPFWRRPNESSFRK